MIRVAVQYPFSEFGAHRGRHPPHVLKAQTFDEPGCEFVEMRPVFKGASDTPSPKIFDIQMIGKLGIDRGRAALRSGVDGRRHLR